MCWVITRWAKKHWQKVTTSMLRNTFVYVVSTLNVEKFPIYIEEVNIKGEEAYERYKKLRAKLTAEELIEIKEKNKRIGFKTGDIDLDVENFDNTFYNWSKSRFDEI